MKKYLFGLLLITVLLCTFTAGAVVVSASSEDVVAPSGWTKIVDETFDNTTGADVDLATIDNTGSPYFSTNWTKVSGSAVVDPQGRVRFIDAGSYKCQIVPENQIYTNVDGDYYMMFDSTFANPANSGSTGVAITESTNNNNRRIFAGANINTNVPYCHIAWTNGTTVQNHNRTIKPGAVSLSEGVYTAELKTCLLQLSIRQGKFATLRYRLFDSSDNEAPSFTPAFWDVVTTAKPSLTVPYDHIFLMGASSAKNQQFYDNIRVYKAPAVNAYTTAAQISGAVIGKTLTLDSDASINAAGYTVVSRKWYDVANPTVTLSTDDNFTPTADMLGKQIKAEVVLSKAGVDTTYVPYLGHVRNPIDVSRLVITAESGTSRDLSLWSNWVSPATNTRIEAKLVLNSNTSLSSLGMKGISGAIIAQYSKDGTLKNVIKTSLDTQPYGSITSVRTINSKITFTLNHNGETTYDPETSGRNYAPGDVFKAFVWASSVNAVGGFTYDIISPIHHIEFGDQPITTFTIPEPIV
ncbi:MAG: hypothetical protein PHE51_08050 [Eubacteriales bacterium]|nr:hypothetical protein [Eubacteriales bacterium]